MRQKIGDAVHSGYTFHYMAAGEEGTPLNVELVMHRVVED